MSDPKDGKKAPHGGIEGVVEMLHFMDEAGRKKLLANLADRDPALVQEILKRMFVFEDLVRLEAREMQALIPAIPTSQLALALRQAGEDLKQHFLSNMTRRAAEELEEEIRTLGPRRVSDIEAARTEIIRIAKELEGKGKLLLEKKSRTE